MISAVLICFAIFSSVAYFKPGWPFEKESTALIAMIGCIVSAAIFMWLDDIAVVEVMWWLTVFICLYATWCSVMPSGLLTHRSTNIGIAIFSFLGILMLLPATEEVEKERLRANNPTAYAELIAREVEKERCGEEIDARAMAKELTKQILKAPSTAEFKSVSIRMEKCGTWKAIVEVDAQNSFGAMLRSKFIVTLQKRSGDKWILLDYVELNN